MLKGGWGVGTEGWVGGWGGVQIDAWSPKLHLRAIKIHFDIAECSNGNKLLSCEGNDIPPLDVALSSPSKSQVWNETHKLSMVHASFLPRLINPIAHGS